MKPKKEYIILAAVIIILSIYLYHRKTDRTYFDIPKLSGIEGKEITKIDITRLDNKLSLIKKDESWFILPQNYKADKNSVDELIEPIESLTLTAMVSETKNYSRYNLDDGQKISVKAWKGDTLVREFDIGKTLTSSQLTFVKIAGHGQVFHARSNFRSKFDTSPGDMRDKSILSFTVPDIKELQIVKENESIHLTRKKMPLMKDDSKQPDMQEQTTLEGEVVWQNDEGHKADETKINSIITTLSSLKCKEYIDGKSKTEFKKPLYTIKLKGAKDYSLLIFKESKKESKEHPAISSESEYPFLLDQWRVKNLIPDFKTLISEPAEKS